ncbi:hypothetical protein B0H63DRAFT_491723 [Podospora didyma]|uniref:Uncharacterized protein n=1 Tax=Podospora didyma TaxID=330526 RepID=A0AAE0P6H0_9PEZI|nr:hypothetical protein B0H63DRAFT_491723 [Podospora didyma]
MAVFFLNGPRRMRLSGVALLLTLLILYNGQHRPLTHVEVESLFQKPDSLIAGSHVNEAQGAKLASEPNRRPPPRDALSTQVDAIYEEGETPGQKATNANLPTDQLDAGETTASKATDADMLAYEPDLVRSCTSFEQLQNDRRRTGPWSEGKRKFPYVRPPPECRKFQLPAMEKLIENMKSVIKDPDLFRLFENTYPNTLDTMVKWRGYANKTDSFSGETEVTKEELTYVITGDIDAMWLRDSASQIFSYLPLLQPSSDPDSLASLWRGLVNSQARYIVISPYCHSFQPPAESGIPPTTNGAYHLNSPRPAYDPQLVFDCKWELDSLASFLQISAAYYSKTNDLDFFGKYSWVDAVRAAIKAAGDMRNGTYDEEGRPLTSAWTFTGYTNRGSETLTNDGEGNPVKKNGMVRSGFRPSDDACIFQLLTPSNMMFAAYLEQASEIAEGLEKKDPKGPAGNLTGQMRELAYSIRQGIARDAVVSHRDFGEIFAYEVDGYGGANLMDDANVPSLLAMPLWNFAQPPPGAEKRSMVKSVVAEEDLTLQQPNMTATLEKIERKGVVEEKKHDYSKIYQNTRNFVLSISNPYFAKGPALSAVGGPHLGPGRGWPMAAIVAALTAFEDISGFAELSKRDEAVAQQLFMVLNSTSGAGVIHETVDAWDGERYTRSWFGWANGLFGELILRIADDEKKRGVAEGKGLLGRSWQD